MAINPFYMYVLEQEGYLTTRESKIQRVIKMVKEYPAETMPEDVFYQVLKDNDIEPSSLIVREYHEIQSAL